MKSVCVIWMDSKEAKLVQVSEDRMQRDSVRADQPDFFKRIAGKLPDSIRILIVGPENHGQKEELKSYLDRNGPPATERIIRCQTTQEGSDAQIATYALELMRGGRQLQPFSP